MDGADNPRSFAELTDKIFSGVYGALAACFNWNFEQIDGLTLNDSLTALKQAENRLKSEVWLQAAARVIVGAIGGKEALNAVEAITKDKQKEIDRQKARNQLEQLRARG